jgi:uncharacterized membrane protein YuzA (DUF378 family)
MKLKTISKWLVVLGAIELGLMAVFGFDLFGMIFGSWPIVLKILYGLMGLSGLWGAYAMLMKKK